MSYSDKNKNKTVRRLYMTDCYTTDCYTTDEDRLSLDCGLSSVGSFQELDVLPVVLVPVEVKRNVLQLRKALLVKETHSVLRELVVGYVTPCLLSPSSSRRFQSPRTRCFRPRSQMLFPARSSFLSSGKVVFASHRHPSSRMLLYSKLGPAYPCSAPAAASTAPV